MGVVLSNPFRSRDFLKLKEHWERILKSEGLEPVSPLNVNYIRKKSECVEEHEYFAYAAKFYWDYRFENETEKEIWFLFSNGQSYKTIQKNMSAKVSIRLIWSTINKLKVTFETYMGLMKDYEEDREE